MKKNLVAEAVAYCPRPSRLEHDLRKGTAHVVRPLFLARKCVERVPLEPARLRLVVATLGATHDRLVVRARVRHDVRARVAVLARVVTEPRAIDAVHLRRVLAHADRMVRAHRQTHVDPEIALEVELQGVLDGLVESDHAADQRQLAGKATRATTDDAAEELTRLRVLLDQHAVHTGHGAELGPQGPDRPRDPPVRLDERAEIVALREELGEALRRNPVAQERFDFFRVHVAPVGDASRLDSHRNLQEYPPQPIVVD